MVKKKNVTFSDIAEYTHFSKTTISRYFNNPDSLTLENQQIIADALEKPGYKEKYTSDIPLGRLAKPEDVANACLFMVSDMGSFITGETLLVDGGYTNMRLVVK